MPPSYLRNEGLTVRPFWWVQSVFDPDGAGRDFAYTVGLHERGFPELHIWARPSMGDDPGLDWMLSTQDRTSVLNHLAAELVEGRLCVGDEVTEELDQGLAVVTFRIDPPGDREELEAYAVPPGVDVLPVRWSLQRAPEGPLIPLADQAGDEACQLFEDLIRDLDSTRDAPEGWQVPARPSLAVDQKFGPLTPVVLARAAQLWQADDETLAWFVDVAAVTNLGFRTSESIAMAVAIARPAGRRAALATLLREAHDLIGRITDAPGARQRFRAVVRALDPEFWSSLDRDQRRNVRRGYAGWLHDLALGCLMVEAVADLAPRSLVLQARGPWLRAQRRESVLTDPGWRAAPNVLEALHEMLGPLDAATMTLIARTHRMACEHAVVGAEGYSDLVARLDSWASTSAASCPWKPELSGLPGWAPLLRGVPGGVIAPMRDLESWATCFTAALTHRGRLSADDVRTFALPFAQDLPTLEKVLNTPL